jgi:crotonobetainyl-CoA:carnitine CoA-transferase CaiB-like acyl-CoA transferase
MTSFSDLFVLETAQSVAGPYCGKLLADHGAVVVKVEHPVGGDCARSAGPFPDGVPDTEVSGRFLHLNTSKRSVALDYSTAAGARRLVALARRAHVIIDDGSLADAGFGPELLAGLSPALVIVELGRGTDAAARQYDAADLVAYAATPWMQAMGRADRPPAYPGREYPAYAAALYATFGVMSALIHARRTGRGQRVSVSVIDAALSIDFYEISTYSYTGAVRRRQGHRISGVAASVQPCADGYVALTINTDRTWLQFCEVIGRPDLAEPPYGSAQDRLDLVETLEPEIRSALSGMTRRELTEECQRRRVAACSVVTIAEVVGLPQLAARNWFRPASHSRAGELQYPGPPFRLSAPQWQLAGPAPLLGEGNDQYLD